MGLGVGAWCGLRIVNFCLLSASETPPRLPTPCVEYGSAPYPVACRLLSVSARRDSSTRVHVPVGRLRHREVFSDLLGCPRGLVT